MRMLTRLSQDNLTDVPEKYVPADRLILSTACAFGLEGSLAASPSYKRATINLSANIGCREVEIPATGPR